MASFSTIQPATAANGSATPAAAAGQLLQCNGTTYFVPSTAVSAVDTTTTLLANISGNLRSVSPYAAATLSGVAAVSIYFFLHFVHNSLICLKGRAITPHRGVFCSLSFLPATPSSWSWALEGLCVCSISLSCMLVPELKRFKDTIWYVALDADQNN